MARILRLLVLLLITSLLCLQPVFAQDDIPPWPTEAWSTSTPEAQGIDSEALVELLQLVHDDNLNFDSILLIRNGYLVLEVYRYPFAVDVTHRQMSITKSVISALVGIAIDNGYIEDTNQRVFELLPELDNQDAKKDSITVENLLTMSAGLNWRGDRAQAILASPVSYPPGTHFQYNNAAARLLLNAIENATNTDIQDFARDGLFDPLGISVQDEEWRFNGSVDGAVGLSLTPQEMAKIGYLYLNGGMWDGQQIISSEWVERSTVPFIEIDLDEPLADTYGYFWWIDRERQFYSAMGTWAQLIVVFPDYNLILVTTGTTTSANPVLHQTIDDFINSLTVSDEPLPENPGAIAELNALTEVFASEAE